ncbi:MAG: hypothetical protein HYV09_03395 [Deltaproteobacteria bacterium]|nr:hypothetical protein [Deltaproteobacteria bacterium]
MKVIPAKDVSTAVNRSCPKCGMPFAPTAQHRPVVVDNDGRPYCQQHAPQVFADYPKLVGAFDDLRNLAGAAVQSGAMSLADAKLCYGLWDGETG